MDMGSDGLSGYMFLDYGMHLNVDITPDFSHGGNRDVINMLHETDLFQLWLLWVISMNLPFGPDQDEQRALAIREALEHAVTSGTPSSSPLFMMQSAGMLEELRLAGVLPEPTQNPEEFLWKYLADRPRILNRRVAMNRFHASVAATELHEKNWRFDCFERTFLPWRRIACAAAGLRSASH
jgi:hypothetical protein